MKLEVFVCRLTIVWMGAIAASIGYMSRYANEEYKSFYNIGPNDDLTILGLPIDNWYKYSALVVYCFINSTIRTTEGYVLGTWILNNIQDDEKKKPRHQRPFAFEASYVSAVYVWFDWFIYMNMLLAQIDMVMIEILAELLVTTYTTKYYLDKEPCETEEKETTPLL